MQFWGFDDMEDIGLFKQGWKWVQSKSNNYSAVKTAAGGFRDKIGKFMERHWPMVCSGCTKFWRLVLLVLRKWKDSTVRGFRSIIELGSAALLIIMWSCFLSLTSMTCLVYVLLSMNIREQCRVSFGFATEPLRVGSILFQGAAGTAIQYLGYTPGLFIVGLFAILILWMYANFWITGTLFVVGGMKWLSPK
ncbi:hypothetical protein CK203_115372 [Vitis vinifera]|uniref:Uncharacterized protein n=1 Tax=Vitis vinifera TaxID=29760 RepID=A0A438D1K5_VITVI|nr:hypothetical protein CK203_115372 [Vitis vinifera]